MIALVAGDPGASGFRCHVLAREAGGRIALIRVS